MKDVDVDLQRWYGVLGHCVSFNKLPNVYFLGCVLKMQVGLGVGGSRPTICPMVVWEALCNYWALP
jgi:hypothetical protein